MRRIRHLLPLLGLGFSLLAPGALGKKDEPKIVIKDDFDHQPRNVLYFEDSDTVLVTDAEAGIVYRSEDGGAEWVRLEHKDGPIEDVMEVVKHPLDKTTAVVLGKNKKHWITHDRGDSWTVFTSEESPSHTQPGITFHATDPKRMLYNAEICRGFLCEPVVYYTTDGFETKPKALGEDVSTCIWAKSTDIFTTGDEKLDKNRILCITKGAWFSTSQKIVYSDDFFESDSTQPTMSNGRTIESVTNIAAVKKYIVFAAKSDRTTEMALYVTDDTKIWHRAEFGEHKLEQDAYTLLESTNYSMQVDVMTTKSINPMGVLLTSNSNGTFFTKNLEHTNRNAQGYVDFEKISNIQGIVVANTVKNWEDVERKWLADKTIVSQISFDDGRTWEDMKAGKDTLHLHSVTESRNIGRIFSSPAPGLVMGIGNTGKSLKNYEEGDLYVSNDAGLHWRRALEKPHIYEFGAQGSILLAVKSGETDVIRWSLNHGKDWEKAKLKEKIKPLALTTTPDSTSLKFLLLATSGGGSKTKFLTIAIDFDKVAPECKKKSEMETWAARVDDDGQPTCIMGHTQKFQRRKPDAECVLIDPSFEDPAEERERCKCTERDFECDYNFRRDEDGKCVQHGPVAAPDGACEGGKTKFKGTSGYRLIPGNDCTTKGGKDLAKQIERDCEDTTKQPVSDEIAVKVTKFKGDKFVEFYYLEREPTAHGDDETIMMRTDRREVWTTHDHGKKWQQILEDEEILAIYPHQYINDYVYMITPSKTVHYSTNRAHDIHKFEAPEDPNRAGIQVLSFHPTQKDWLLWTGSKDCKGTTDCLTIAHVSTKGGEDWRTLRRAVRKCQFVYEKDRHDSDRLVYCEQFENENKDGSLLLLSSDDFFEHEKELKRDVINFATMAEYIVVAVRDAAEETLKVDTSIDGVSFADAKFPKNFHVPHQQAYTVLDSSTHAIFLHVTVNNIEGQEYGSIIKSNSNGTSYVLSVAEVNRNDAGYVDFEKMQGLEGVAVINRVANAREVDAGSSKKLQTWITHNDGGDWALLGRPQDPPKEAEKSYGCSISDNEKCNLHLHGYTERKDPRDTYSSASAVGLMMGTGNVGEFLGYKKEADTFITRDGGVSWNFVAPGNWMWEYGDQGSIIVIVKEDESTDFIHYTLDEGRSWKQFKFGEEMMVDDITTVPSDTSRNFLLWGKIGSDIATINIDFSGLKVRSEQCRLDEKNPEDTNLDYDLWKPSHPLSQDNCLFGHVAQYHRKKYDRDCYNGANRDHLHSIEKNCTCTRRDFECDYNYERTKTQECRLVQGLQKPDPAEVCRKNKDLTEYYEITGYRRIPLTTCSGGLELDLTSRTHACPGKEEDYKKKHGISGAGLFFAIVLPVAAAAGVGYWVWKNWDGKFGRIRLGENMSSGGIGDAFDGDQPWVKYPVMLVSGIAAVIAAIPMLVGSIWRLASSSMGRSSGYSRPYTSRSSFQRGRGDYAVVDPDEGELLGDDSDDEV